MFVILIVINIFTTPTPVSPGNGPHMRSYLKYHTLASAKTTPVNISTKFRNRYNYPSQINPTVKPTICIISLGGSFLTTDLNTYWTESGLGQNITPVRVHQVDGVTNKADMKLGSSGEFYDASMENTLDLEIAMTLCPSANIHIFFGPNTTEGFYNAIQAAVTFLGSATGGKIISISWGSDELSYGPAQAARYDLLFSNARSAGISICAASGDNSADDGSGFLSLDFPSSSPNVISCGGTSWNGASESAWSYNSSYKWGGGGGLSLYFQKQSYQNSLNWPSNVGRTSLATARSSPDIALNADPLNGWAIKFNGSYITIGGTSCVAPAFSAFLGLCNSTNYNGSINALTKLYSANAGFNDIVTGTNNSLGLPGFYSAHAGFDQCTGLGTINGTILQTLM